MSLLPDTAALAERLAKLLGGTAIVTDEEERAFLSSDVYSSSITAALAIRPGSRDRLPDAVRAISEAGFAITPRGGGMSYTGGYVPSRARTVALDLRGLNRIVEVNEADRVITVEAGVTWHQIWKTLDPLGLRLPFFGTFSGHRATVGGGLSNGALFMGTARHGTAAEIVTGLEVIDGRGRLIRTGQTAFHNGRPGFRNFGPDMTGLFVHDAGALGIKTLASLRIMERPAATEFSSFAFAGQLEAVRALSDIARAGVTEEAYIFDPATTRRSLEPASLKRDMARLREVMRQEDSAVRGLKEGAKMVASGRRFVADGLYTLHCVCAGRSRAEVEADVRRVETLARDSGGLPIANTIPKAARAKPFEPLNGILGADGERWAALNAKVPHSDAGRLIAATEELLSPYRERMEALGVSTSFLYIAIGNHIFSYEPVLRWYDRWLPVHRRTPEPDHLARLNEPAPNPEASALVHEIRCAIVSLFAQFGAASNQIGKTYPLLESMNAQTRAVLRALKSELDPDGLLNPGALGAFELSREEDNAPG